MSKEILLFPFSLIVRPFSGYWDLKYEGKGNLKMAALIFFLVFISMIFQKQYAGFIVNFANPAYFNSLNELMNLLLPFFLWCVANWSLTTLMDGEGKFTEIVMASAYALMPMFIIYIPNTIISNFMTQEESVFYVFFNSAAMIWTAYLLFVGTMTVHQYTVKKTVVTILLTLLCMGFLLFLGLLFFSLIQQMYSFFFTIYQEFLFRN
ncbi:Yip1 family protein [Paenibacillus sp. PAMC21692]|uniref:Yip1 family protein n=1 Tax=Paenibacillus sp. PAMC21692 TaxID=2762320 RepID=UPI00164D63E8|nr:Yip1 family protein [Paenibacillus sp. PAMC21692]QNK57034.1 YIP1 family protein [Paenibacillus sp. PAMC21692]